MKNFADITFLVDRSGSMSTIKDAMETAIEQFIKEHREVPSTRVTLIQFDDKNDQHVVFQSVPVEAVEKVKIEPRGWTPLNDALCKAIDRTGERYSSMNEANRPNKVLFVVITDGQENSSKTYNRSNVKDRITKQQDIYNWQFVYLGANQDVFHESASMGIKWGNALSYVASDWGATNAMKGLLTNTMSYTRGTTSSVPNFTDAQREAAVENNENFTTSWSNVSDNLTKTSKRSRSKNT